MRLFLKKPDEQPEHWEYGSFDKIYGPIYPIFIRLMAKASFRFFVTAANPGLENGGFVMESKKKIYDVLPPDTYPKTFLFQVGTSADEVFKKMQESRLQFPVILKPDIGGRGMGVVLVKDREWLKHYVSCYPLPFLLQAYMDYPLEAGIFYVKMPHETKGKITGIVSKEFGKITGDGKSSLQVLIRNNERLNKQYALLSNQYCKQLHDVLKKGEEIMLIPFGNHARGAAFYNASEEADEHLTNLIDGIAAKIPGFYYGRFDIRFRNWNTLRKGTDFSIIELNGSGSEPTHIYDPSQSLEYARSEIVRHWQLLYEIARINMKNGIKAASLLEGLKLLRANKKMGSTLKALNEKIGLAPLSLTSNEEYISSSG